MGLAGGLPSVSYILLSRGSRSLQAANCIAPADERENGEKETIKQNRFRDEIISARRRKRRRRRRSDDGMNLMENECVTAAAARGVAPTKASDVIACLLSLFLYLMNDDDDDDRHGCRRVYTNTTSKAEQS